MDDFMPRNVTNCKSGQMADKAMSNSRQKRWWEKNARLNFKADLEEYARNDNICKICRKRGELLMCDGTCGASFHLACIGLKVSDLPEGDWFCVECTAAQKQRDKIEDGDVRAENNAESNLHTIRSVSTHECANPLPAPVRPRQLLSHSVPAPSADMATQWALDWVCLFCSPDTKIFKQCGETVLHSLLRIVDVAYGPVHQHVLQYMEEVVVITLDVC